MEKQVMHIDVTSFAVSVERIIDPRLKGRPVIIAFPGMERSLVYTSSQEARDAGIRSGMSLQLARKLCRDIMIVPPNQMLYTRAMNAILGILRDFTPVIEPAGYGRAYLDMTGTARLFGPPKDCAARVQREIETRLRLQSTLGIAGNKLVSKIASRIISPVSLQDVARGSEQRFIAPLPVQYLPGIDERITQQLLEFNIRRIRQIAALPLSHLTTAFGRVGLRLHQASRGVDKSPVQPPQRTPGIFNEHTLAEDSNDFDYLRSALNRMVEESALRLRRSQRATKRIFMEIEYSDHKKSYGQKTLTAPTNMTRELFEQSELLLSKVLTLRTRVRKLGLHFHRLSPVAVQASLFATPADARYERLSCAMDRIRDRFGDDAIKPAFSV